jgi:hypothetical protein
MSPSSSKTFSCLGNMGPKHGSSRQMGLGSPWKHNSLRNLACFLREFEPICHGEQCFPRASSLCNCVSSFVFICLWKKMRSCKNKNKKIKTYKVVLHGVILTITPQLFFLEWWGKKDS